MFIDEQTKKTLKRDLISCLEQDSEIERIVIFGSFLSSDTPNDMDVAIFQNSQESYLSLALKYRRQTRSVAHRIPLDIIPVHKSASKTNSFLQVIEAGEVIYEQ